MNEWISILINYSFLNDWLILVMLAVVHERFEMVVDQLQCQLCGWNNNLNKVWWPEPLKLWRSNRSVHYLSSEGNESFLSEFDSYDWVWDRKAMKANRIAESIRLSGHRYPSLFYDQNCSLEESLPAASSSSSSSSFSS